MPRYEFTWSAFGTLEVEAPTKEEAQQIASEELGWLSAHDVDRFDVDGYDINDA